MKEIWKDIPGYEGYYQISSIGRVKAVARTITGRWGKQRLKELIRRNGKNPKGYQLVDLHKNNISQTITIHRLVAMAFIVNPENKPCINHKNGIKDDNRVENLEWCTYAENNQHAIDTGLTPPPQKGKVGKLHNCSKPVIQKRLDGSEIAKYECVRQASELTGANKSKISAVCRGERKTTGGYKWEYLPKQKG